MILDLALPDMSGLEFLRRLQQNKGKMPPVIVHTGKDLDETEYRALREYTDRIVVKGATSGDRLLEEVSLFLHSVSQKVPHAQKVEKKIVTQKEALSKRKVMIVDDDVRNTFALAKALKPYGLDLILADDGRLALQKLDEVPDIELVLMDIMMPVMDGHETMRRIRSDERWKDLPMIALTAKAMAEDREKCIAAGANDYLPKPVDVDRLIAMMQVWLTRKS